MRHSSYKTLALNSLCLFSGALAAPLLQAGTPLGWISGDFVSAYTQNAGALEITGQRLAVNDTIDFLDVREEMIAGNRRLIGNSGDLKGWQGSLRYGIFDSLEVFYQRQEHDLVLKLGPISSLNITDIDQELQTTVNEAGFKWTFYQAGFQNPNNETTAASLELAWVGSETRDFNLTFDSISLNAGSSSATISFDEEQTAGINNLEDEGWRARVIYTRPLLDGLVGSVWAGYSDRSATSGTGTSITFNALRDALTQRFDVDENQLMLGASMSWQLRPRLPLQLSYEYIKINDQSIDAQQSSSGFSLPGFLSSSNLSTDDANHVLSGSLSWWITPDFNVGLTGKLYSNQFLGLTPHYNNPLSSSFSDEPYGYLGLRVGLNLW